MYSNIIKGNIITLTFIVLCDSILISESTGEWPWPSVPNAGLFEVHDVHAMQDKPANARCTWHLKLSGKGYLELLQTCITRHDISYPVHRQMIILNTFYQIAIKFQNKNF